MKAYKFRLYPTESQKELLAQHFGSCRYIYNRALDLKTKAYEESQQSLNGFTISNEMTKWKQDLPWLKAVNSQSLQMALKHLDSAFTSFFRKQGRYPRFKKRGGHQSFSCPQNCKADFDGQRFRLPKFKGGIKCIFHRRFEGEIKTCTVSMTPTGKYFVSILVEQPDRSVPMADPTLGKSPLVIEPTLGKCLGIDLGIQHFAIFSDGKKIANPKPLSRKLKKLKRQQRKLSRKKRQSNNRTKQRKIVARLHEKVANFRLDFLHKLSHSIAENQSYTSVSMETLDIKAMLGNANRQLARHIGDAGWYTFQTLLSYKLADRGKAFLKIGQYEPSSKKCGNCGSVNRDLALKDRVWQCPSCGQEHDRDINAAINIRNLAFCRNDRSTDNKFLGSGRPESTLVEIGISQSLKQEALPFKAG